MFPENKTRNYKRYLVEDSEKNISFIEAYGGDYYDQPRVDATEKQLRYFWTELFTNLDKQFISK